MLKIDLENHFYDESTLEAFAARCVPPFFNQEEDYIKWMDEITMPQGGLLPKLLETGEERIRLFDRLGIDTAVLSSSPGPEQLEAADSIRVCRLTNDALGTLVKKYPGRFLGSAILPVKDITQACAEMERCVEKYGFVAWHTHSNYGDSAPDDIRYRPLFQKAADQGIYVYLHPQLPDEKRLKGFGFTFAGPGLGFTLDAVTTLMRMIVSGVFDEIPHLKIVLGHLGEGLPFLLERISNRIKFIPNPDIKCQQDISYYFKHNIWVTTSGNMSKDAFECTKNVLGMDHILFASDYPYESADEMMDFLDSLSLSEPERHLLYHGNAAASLGINLKK